MNAAKNFVMDNKAKQISRSSQEPMRPKRFVTSSVSNKRGKPPANAKITQAKTGPR